MTSVLDELNLQPERIAVEQNGQIIPRSMWTTATVSDGDRLEVVHFVGGGTPGSDDFTRLCSSSSQRRP